MARYFSKAWWGKQSPNNQRFWKGASYFVPISRAPAAAYRVDRFRRSGGFYLAGKAGRKGSHYYRRVARRVRRPVTSTKTYGRISRRLPFHKSRSAYRKYTDVAADAAAVYYGGRKVYGYSRRLGASSKSSPSRTAYSQVSKPSGKRYTPKKARRRPRRRSGCPPGYYYNRKAGRCLRSKF